MDVNNTLSSALGNLPAAPRNDFTVASIYFPGYHATPYHNAMFGWGWSEWELVRRCQFLSQISSQPKVMVLNAWNEWTEGSVLAPTKDQGFAVLDALRDALAM
jgi:hypothetical protein